MKVKICGLTDAAAVAASVRFSAAYVGFVFFEKSPRHLSYEAAKALSGEVPPGLCRVALVVNPTDQALDELLAAVPIDMLQLHGHETPERVSKVKALSGLPVMKAVGVAGEDDLPTLADYAQTADQILVDAKPPRDAGRPGGNGLSFDWRLIQGRRWAVPWMLAGGLNADNVREAVRLTGARQVDVSSDVEAAPGRKDPARIEAFLKAAMQD